MKVLLQVSSCMVVASALSVPKPDSRAPPQGAAQQEGLPNVFALMDTNQDKQITLDEYKTFFEEQGLEVNMGAYKFEDQDSDNIISYAEFQGPKGDPEHDALYQKKLEATQRRAALRDDMFTAMDANGDVKITKQELTSFFNGEGQVPEEGLFEGEDKDSDGLISWTEFSGPKGQSEPAPGQQQANPQGEMPNLFVLMDDNRDGKITRRELEDYFEEVSGDPPSKDLFNSEDADKSGAISWEEFSGPKGQAPPDYSAPEFQQETAQPNIFRDMDEDGDARVSHAEFHRYFEEVLGKDPPPNLWTSEDADSDGFLTWHEFSGSKGDSPPGEEGQLLDVNLFASMDVDGNQLVSKQEMRNFFLQSSGVEPEELLFESEDANSDGAISWAEFSGPKGTGPKDRSKAFTAQQVKQMNEENAAANGEDAEPVNLFAEMDANNDNRVSEEEMNTYFLDVTGEPSADGLFDAEDADHDGFISFDEFTGPKGLPADIPNVFAQMDVDDSNTISRDEFDSYFEVIAQGVPEEGFFEREDADSDNVISFDEFSGPKGENAAQAADTDLFSPLDLNGDRKVEWDEFQAFFEYHNEVPDRGVFNAEDKNRDGIITWEEFTGPKGSEDEKPRNFFAEMDIEYGNADGKVSRAEMNVWYMINSGRNEDCPDELWQESDQNRDGQVTWDEFDDMKGTITDRPADNHKAPANLVPDAQSELGPLQKANNAKCWTRTIPPASDGEEAAEVLQCLPHFILAGTARSASTTLYDLLVTHPSLEMFETFEQKELNFWNTVPQCQPFDYAMLLPSIERGSDVLTGEGSVRYLVHPMAPARIKQSIPDTKFLITVRNPVLRMFSHWRMEHFLMQGRDPRDDFNLVALEELAKVPADASSACMPAAKANANPEHCFKEMFDEHLWREDTVQGVPYTNYLDWSTYHYQLERWLQHFPLSQFHFVDFNEMKTPEHVDAQMSKVHDFLNIPEHSYKDADGNVRFSNINDQGTEAVMDRDTLKRLRDFFEPHNREFYKMVGIDFGWEKEIDDKLEQMELRQDL